MSNLSNSLLKFKVKGKVFDNFNAEEIKILSQYLSVKQFINGQVLMKKGEAGTYLGIILSGKVDIKDEGIVIVTRSAGDLLGEMALIRSSPRTADVIAVSDGKIAIMPYDDIEQFKTDYPGIAVKLVGILTESTMKKLSESEAALRAEKQKSEQLLLNILPKPIVDRLKQGEKIIADSFAEATVLFADIVRFTEISACISSRELVVLLNEIFSMFDRLAEQHDLEKIKTIGDAYMVVGGVPVPRDDHAEKIAQMALDMQEEITCLDTGRNESFQIRIGINTGEVVAGVIGEKKFIYDLWGNTVNVASRMESSGLSGRIQVTAETYNRLKDKYIFEERGTIKVKGIKKMFTTYWLTGKR